MVELQHRDPPPVELVSFRNSNPQASVGDFDQPSFQAIKRAVKASLNADQGGLCVYCEEVLASDKGQLEHIKPRSSHPDLCFTYTNHAHSCINSKSCGQKKKDGILPIEPGPDCNNHWWLSDKGTIEPVPDLTRQQRHHACQTRDMLGLNNANLVNARKKWFGSVQEVLRRAPDDVQLFLQQLPYRHILATTLHPRS